MEHKTSTLNGRVPSWSLILSLKTQISAKTRAPKADLTCFLKVVGEWAYQDVNKYKSLFHPLCPDNPIWQSSIIWKTIFEVWHNLSLSMFVSYFKYGPVYRKVPYRVLFHTSAE